VRGHGDRRLLPRGSVRSDEQLRRDRAGVARPGPPGRLRHRGVVRGLARGAGLRGAAHAARVASRGRGGAWPVLEGLHPRDGAGLPQAHHRAALRVHRADLACTLRWRALRGRSVARDLPRDRARRGRGGQRRLLSRDSRIPASMGAHRLVQSARGEGLGNPHPSTRATPQATARVGTSFGTSTRERPPICTPSSPRSSRNAARPRCPRPSSSTSRPG